MAFLALQGISKRFGGVAALDGVDLQVDAGTVHCLAGANGSGKSTLIKIVAGVERAEPGGRIVVDGAVQPRLTPARSARLGIQVIYQDLSLFPYLTVAENVAIGRHRRALRLVDRGAMRRAAVAAMARVGVAIDPDAVVRDLPIARRQLVAIARAMASDARLLIMDEPTASLTRAEVDALFARVRALRDQGVAVLFVSHRLDEVMEISARVTVLRDGRKVGSFDAPDVTPGDLAALMVGRAVSHSPPVPPADARPVLSARGLGRRDEFRDVDLDLRPGEIVGLTGLIGAGRTELALALFGMRPADAGTIAIDGAPVGIARNADATGRGIAYVSEDRLTLGLALDQAVRDNLLIAVLRRLAGRLGLVPPSRRAAEAGALIRTLSIKVADPGDAAATLSGGNQQRVALGKWIATRPRVLILDNPTAGVDVGAKAAIYAIVRRLAGEGVAILLISDEIAEAFDQCHRVLVMRAGRIAGEIVPGESTPEALRAAVHG
ncbi:MAG: sugar ABC transporter ATP-binding protein [Alphaproteobacteria bacterium]